MAARAASLIAIAAGLFALGGPCTGQSRTVHKDERLGFSVAYPVGWSVIPARAGERWILARFQSDRSYTLRDAQGLTRTHEPLLRVLLFPKDVQAVEHETVGGAEITRITSPYRDYDDYFKRNAPEGGYYASREDPLTLRGMKATYKEIKIEKLTDLPRRHLAVVYHLDDREMVVEVDVLENEADAFARQIAGCLRSLEVFAPKGGAAEPSAAPPSGLVVGLSEEEVEAKWDSARRAWRKRVLEEAERTLPKGWLKKSDKDFLFLSHSSPKYTEYIVQQAKTVRKWLDLHFKEVGGGEVMRVVVRVCADWSEAATYLSGSGDSYSWETSEVVCAGGTDILNDFSRVASGITIQYLNDKNPALWRAMPPWLSSGLSDYVASGRVSKIKGFVFVADASAFAHARTLVQEDRMISLLDLVTKPWPELAAGRLEGERDAAVLSSLFVRFLLEGPGARGKSKGILAAYMKHAVAALDARDKTSWKELLERKVETKEPVTEEEEEARFRQRQQESKEWDRLHAEERKKLLVATHDLAFAGWSLADWDRLDRAFRAYVLAGGR